MVVEFGNEGTNRHREEEEGERSFGNEEEEIYEDDGNGDQDGGEENDEQRDTEGDQNETPRDEEGNIAKEDLCVQNLAFQKICFKIFPAPLVGAVNRLSACWSYCKKIMLFEFGMCY